MQKARTLPVLILLVLSTGLLAAQGAERSAIAKLRMEYYKAVQGDTEIDTVIQRFNHLAVQDSVSEGVVQTYVGSLTALKATQVFWPRKKLHWANEGLEIMDHGLKKAEGDLEAIFIHSTTCYHLPFFFGRRDDARRGFREIAERLPADPDQVDDSLFGRITAFLKESELLDDSTLVRMEERVDQIHQRGEEGQ